MSIFTWKEPSHASFIRPCSWLVLIQHKIAQILLQHMSKPPVTWAYPKVSLFFCSESFQKLDSCPQARQTLASLPCVYSASPHNPSSGVTRSIGTYWVAIASIHVAVIPSSNMNMTCTANSADNAKRRVLLKASLHWMLIKPSDTHSRIVRYSCNTHIAVHLERHLPLPIHSISKRPY